MVLRCFSLDSNVHYLFVIASANVPVPLSVSYINTDLFSFLSIIQLLFPNQDLIFFFSPWPPPHLTPFVQCKSQKENFVRLFFAYHFSFLYSFIINYWTNQSKLFKKYLNVKNGNLLHGFPRDNWVKFYLLALKLVLNNWSVFNF